MDQARNRHSAAASLMWTYGVVRARDSRGLDLRGVHQSTCAVVAHGDLAAVVSAVPRAEFSAPCIVDNLNRLEWLEAVAREHDGVLHSVMRRWTVAPFRLCTLFDSRSSVRDMLGREAERLRRTLELLDGRSEWSAKVVLTTQPDELRRDDVAATPAAEGPGREYLMRKRQERENVLQARASAAELAGRIDTHLRRLAVAAVNRPPQRGPLAQHTGTMVLNAAYLVENHDGERLRSVVHDLNAQHGGFTVELTGPWPAYNFVPDGSPSTVAPA